MKISIFFLLNISVLCVQSQNSGFNSFVTPLYYTKFLSYVSSGDYVVHVLGFLPEPWFVMFAVISSCLTVLIVLFLLLYYCSYSPFISSFLFLVFLFRDLTYLVSSWDRGQMLQLTGRNLPVLMEESE